MININHCLIALMGFVVFTFYQVNQVIEINFFIVLSLVATSLLSFVFRQQSLGNKKLTNSFIIYQKTY